MTPNSLPPPSVLKQYLEMQKFIAEIPDRQGIKSDSLIQINDALKEYASLTARNEELTSKLARMEAAGDAMKNMVIRKNHYHQYTCELCDAYADTVDEIVHAPDCPVTLWSQAKIDKEVG